MNPKLLYKLAGTTLGLSVTGWMILRSREAQAAPEPTSWPPGLPMGTAEPTTQPATPDQEPKEMPNIRQELENKVRTLLAPALGWTYWWGRGNPATAWRNGPNGVDCSGFALMALVRLGLISPTTPDMASDTMRMQSTPIPTGQQRPGDLAFWNRHVEVVTGWPDASGHSRTIGASGGDSATFGNKPGAEVKYSRGGPRAGKTFLGYGRLVQV